MLALASKINQFQIHLHILDAALRFEELSIGRANLFLPLGAEMIVSRFADLAGNEISVRVDELQAIRQSDHHSAGYPHFLPILFGRDHQNRTRKRRGFIDLDLQDGHLYHLE
jgi:hypothetical protein